MLASVRAFLEGIIDYAGLFPPAELTFDQAFAHYLRYRREAASWMLGRFICPAVRLKELAVFREELARSGPLRLAVLGRGGKDEPDFMANLERDLDDIAQLAQALGISSFAVESFEVKMPAGLLDASPPESLAKFINAVAERLNTIKASLFFECPELKSKTVDHFAAGLQQARRAGWKLRCGGLVASAFPTPAEAARVLCECCSAGIAWKATAGLHHPLRHFDPNLGTSMHGFVNIFGAAILAHARQMTREQLEEMLADEDAGHFVVDEHAFTWKSLRATTEEIRLARKRVVTSFGSCSFEEPCDDLGRLGWS